MPPRLRSLAVLLLSAGMARPLIAQSLSVSAAREDFDVLWKSIREAHGGLSRHVAPQELDRKVAGHRARIDQPMSRGAFAGLVQESISELRDGHMRLEPDSETAAALATAAVVRHPAPAHIRCDARRHGPGSRGWVRLTSQQHRGVDEQAPVTTPYLGKLVVLIDGGTFSTAADVAAQLRSMGRAIFIGEETGGGYEGNTSGLNALIILPNSRLRLRIMMYDYWNALKPPAMRGRGTIPDRAVVRRVADYIRGVDPPLEEAIRILR